MTLSPWIRLWLPLGNTFLLVAILETVDVIRHELKDIGIFLYQWLGMQSTVAAAFYNSGEIIFLSILLAVKVIATLGLLWIGAVTKGNKTSLLIWIIITSVLAVGCTIFLIIFAVTLPSDIGSIHAWSIVYSIFILVLLNSYMLFIAIATYKALGKQETLHPIGKGPSFIWEYFSNDAKIASVFFLTTEIMLDGDYLISRQFMKFFGMQLQGHDGDSYPPIIIEEIIMRVIRIVVNAVGLWLVVKEKRKIFRWWCAFTFLLILTSTGIFIALTVLWRGEDISSTLAYFLMFPGHLLFRFVTLYFCLKFTRADFSRYVL